MSEASTGISTPGSASQERTCLPPVDGSILITAAVTTRSVSTSVPVVSRSKAAMGRRCQSLTLSLSGRCPPVPSPGPPGGTRSASRGTGDTDHETVRRAADRSERGRRRGNAREGGPAPRGSPRGAAPLRGDRGSAGPWEAAGEQYRGGRGARHGQQARGRGPQDLPADALGQAGRDQAGLVGGDRQRRVAEEAREGEERGAPRPATASSSARYPSVASTAWTAVKPGSVPVGPSAAPVVSAAVHPARPARAPAAAARRRRERSEGDACVPGARFVLMPAVSPGR